MRCVLQLRLASARPAKPAKPAEMRCGRARRAARARQGSAGRVGKARAASGARSAAGAAALSALFGSNRLVTEKWPTLRGMLPLDTSPRFKAGKLFHPKRVSGGGKEY